VSAARPTDRRPPAIANPLEDGDRTITLRHMAIAELDRIGEIDRAERVTREYSYRGGFGETDQHWLLEHKPDRLGMGPS
jgi:hypothetical protein